jgi:AcrR family transcriptional regulator
MRDDVDNDHFGHHWRNYEQSQRHCRERPYHHGDLQRAIVNAALEVLSETQSTEFSLRELARRAGVTHNAPYKHFADKRELLAAVSAVGFDLLAKRLTNAMQGQTSPRARLFAIARDYVRHGVENPALYRLMFGGYLTGPDEARPAIEIAAAEKTKALLADAIAQGALGRPLPEDAAKRAEDRRGHPDLLVADARAHLAAGRPVGRPEPKDR